MLAAILIYYKLWLAYFVQKSNEIHLIVFLCLIARLKVVLEI
jgi:hypothetical protein